MGRYMSRAEYKRRVRRKDSYHLVASRNRLPADPDEQEEDMLFRYITSSQTSAQKAKIDLLRELGRSGGDVTIPPVEQALQQLLQVAENSIDLRKTESIVPSVEGMWIEISKPKFHGCLGVNANRDFVYSLGRMSFEMFRPISLLCSIQGAFNPVHEVNLNDIEHTRHHIPDDVLQKLRDGDEGLVLRSYDVVTAFTIETDGVSPKHKHGPNSSLKRPIEGLMTTYGYVLSHPEKANRLSIWFTDGSLEVVDSQNEIPWIEIFSSNPHNVVEDDGKMSYHLPRPAGGGGTYVDILYMDETLRIVRSSGDLIYIFCRVPSFPDE